MNLKLQFEWIIPSENMTWVDFLSKKKGPILLMSFAPVSFKIFSLLYIDTYHECELYVDPNYIIMQTWHIVVSARVSCVAEVYEVNQLA